MRLHSDWHDRQSQIDTEPVCCSTCACHSGSEALLSLGFVDDASQTVGVFFLTKLNTSTSMDQYCACLSAVAGPNSRQHAASAQYIARFHALRLLHLLCCIHRTTCYKSLGRSTRCLKISIQEDNFGGSFRHYLGSEGCFHPLRIRVKLSLICPALLSRGGKNHYNRYRANSVVSRYSGSETSTEFSFFNIYRFARRQQQHVAVIGWNRSKGSKLWLQMWLSTKTRSWRRPLRHSLSSHQLRVFHS